MKVINPWLVGFAGVVPSGVGIVEENAAIEGSMGRELPAEKLGVQPLVWLFEDTAKSKMFFPLLIDGLDCSPFRILFPAFQRGEIGRDAESGQHIRCHAIGQRKGIDEVAIERFAGPVSLKL